MGMTSPYNRQSTYTPSLTLSMSVELMVNTLRLGNTGREILHILDAVASNDQFTTPSSVCQVAYKQPTADVIDF